MKFIKLIIFSIGIVGVNIAKGVLPSLEDLRGMIAEVNFFDARELRALCKLPNDERGVERLERAFRSVDQGSLLQDNVRVAVTGLLLALAVVQIESVEPENYQFVQYVGSSLKSFSSDEQKTFNRFVRRSNLGVTFNYSTIISEFNIRCLSSGSLETSSDEEMFLGEDSD